MIATRFISALVSRASVATTAIVVFVNRSLLTFSSSASGGDFSGAPQVLVDARTQAAHRSAIDRSRYEIVRDVKRLKAWVARAQDLGLVAIDTDTVGWVD